ncbi:MAG: amino acid adenylation domain-containing protein [Dactylosporangium sp.]|nr:amino acid adenylation domain-containing protein [Dactylosporangium sp.]
MADLNERLRALSPEKRALFNQLLEERGRAENVFPISVAQQGIWFLEQLRPNTVAYVMPAAVRIRGPLQPAPLRDAINETVRRHESLRTTFQLREGKPMQVVQWQLPVDLPEEDLRPAGDPGGGGSGPGDLEAKIDEVLGEPFDLAAGPLVRVRLLRTGTDEHVLVVAMHHLIADGWSVGILFSEVAALYEAFTGGRPATLPELKIQYGDYAIWQRQRSQHDSHAADLTHWRRHLAGAPAAIELPTDRIRPAVQGFNGGSVPFGLPEPLMRDLGALAKRHHATTFMALLAVFQILLHRYSNQGGVVVGVPTVTRDRPELEPVIGYFLNLLPVHTDLGDNPDFGVALRRVREACIGAYAHQGVPFDKVVEDLRPPRDLSRSPIFQVCFSYQSEPMPTLSAAGAEFTRLPFRAKGSRFDLELQSFHDGGGLTGDFWYDRDLFDESTIVRLAAHFRRLAESITAHPELPIEELELLDDVERRQILVDGNATDREWPGTGLIHQCFGARALAAPQAEAVRFEGTSLSYGELNRRANQLAHRLRRLDVRPEVLVGVSMERSIELVVSLLAVLKAGGAYLPLDPGYPRGRLEYMLADARVPVLLTQRRLVEDLPPSEARVLCVDELAADPADPADNPDVPLDGRDLAYVIYTSGSTGQPKGVMNVHAAIRNRLLWMQDTYRLDATDRVLQKTPFSFDVSVWEFFWPLMSGATLVVASPGAHRDSRALAETIRAERVTTVHFVPSMLQVFLRDSPVERLTTLRRVVCSGEALPRDLQERFLERSPAQLHNLYGPTEAAVDVTSWACRRDGDPRPVPIGFPIANTKMYVLGRSLRPVPVGVPGELYIGGVGLARGYLNQRELTATRFVADPFGPRPGARLYATGDLARYRDDGAIDYLGRLDRQVKVRGFRIELGEIESVLAQHERVRAAIVVARERGAGDTRLVAYLTSDGQPGSAPPSAGDLIGFLKERLPEYMVPAAFVALPELPFLPNGKVDKAALVEPDAGRPELLTPFVAPRDARERAIAAVWREILGVEQVGVHDNFFELGGHSLLLPQLRTTLATTLGREVAMVELFQYPTVGSLAGYLSRPAAAGVGSVLDANARAEHRRQSQDQRQQASARRMRARSR